MENKNNSLLHCRTIATDSFNQSTNKISEINNKQKINWNGFWSYIQHLRQSKEKNKVNEIINYLNCYLLSPHLLSPNNISYYYEALSLLSFYYLQKEYLSGLDWVYRCIKRVASKQIKEVPKEIQIKINYRYAKLLKDKNEYVSYAYNILNEVNEFEMADEMKKEFDTLKDEIENKMKDDYNEKEQKIPFDWSNVNKDDDCWNPYIDILLNKESDININHVEHNKDNINDLLTNKTNESQEKRSGKNHVDRLGSQYIRQYLNVQKTNASKMRSKSFHSNKISNEMSINDLLLSNGNSNENNNNNCKNLDNIQKAKKDSRKKIKVLLLTENKSIPFLPRTIYYKNNQKFNEIISKLGILKNIHC